MAGLLDIYSKFSVIVCQLQKVKQLPFERYDEFQKLCQDIRKMTENVDAHTSCAPENCSWPTLHSDKEHILSGNVSKDLTVSSTEGESVFNTRSVARLLQAETEKTFEEKVNESLKTFATTLFQELSTVFQTKDRECVEQSRTLADWKSMAINLKEKSPALLFSLENVKFVATARQMDRNLRDIDIEVMKSQFKTFLYRIYSLTKDKVLSSFKILMLRSL